VQKLSKFVVCDTSYCFTVLLLLLLLLLLLQLMLLLLEN